MSSKLEIGDAGTEPVVPPAVPDMEARLLRHDDATDKVPSLWQLFRDYYTRARASVDVEERSC